MGKTCDYIAKINDVKTSVPLIYQTINNDQQIGKNNNAKEIIQPIPSLSKGLFTIGFKVKEEDKKLKP